MMSRSSLIVPPRQWLQRFFIIGATLFFAACGGGGGGSGPSGPTFDLTGAWTGTETLTAPAQLAGTTRSFKLNIVGTSGSYSNDIGDAGTFATTATGTTFTGHSVSAVTRATCDFNGVISNGGTQLSATFACSDGFAGTVTVARS